MRQCIISILLQCDPKTALKLFVIACGLGLLPITTQLKSAACLFSGTTTHY